MSKTVIYVLVFLAGVAFSTQVKSLPVIGSILSKVP